MDPPHGPFKIGKNRQITVPADLLKRTSLEPGDSVYVALTGDRDGTLTIIPMERLLAWIADGKQIAEAPPPPTDSS